MRCHGDAIWYWYSTTVTIGILLIYATILYIYSIYHLQPTARTKSVHLPLQTQLHKQDISSVEKQSDCRGSLYRMLIISFVHHSQDDQLTVHTLDDDLLLEILLTARTLQQFLLVSLDRRLKADLRVTYPSLPLIAIHQPTYLCLGQQSKLPASPSIS
jgi:hypothetical protein